jgi:hypothetical protein
MRITDCSIERSFAMAGAWVFSIEIGGNKFTGHFGDFGGFITMVTECAKFFAIRNGLLRVRDAGLTRQVMPGDGRGVLPGDKAQ